MSDVTYPEIAQHPVDQRCFYCFTDAEWEARSDVIVHWQVPQSFCSRNEVA